MAPFGRDKWVNMTQDPTTGAITLGTPYTRRTPWFTQTDFNIGHHIKTGEHQTLGFTVTFQNLLNQRAVTSYYGGMNSVFFTTPLIPGTTLPSLTRLRTKRIWVWSTIRSSLLTATSGARL